MDDLSDISLRRLRAFLAVCETEHMGRAAARLGIAQPGLSQQIRALEDAFGVRLFDRRNRGIVLTAAGEAACKAAARLVEDHGRAVTEIRNIGRGAEGRLALGYVGSALVREALTAQLQAFRSEYPEIRILLETGSIESLLGRLKQGEVDAAILRAPVQIEAPLTHAVYEEEELVVALPADHRLTRHASLVMRDLAGEPLVAFPDDASVGVMSTGLEFARKHGVPLDVAWRAGDTSSLLSLVAAGMGYAIVPESLGGLMGDRVVLRPFADAAPRTALWIVWNGQRDSEPLRHFRAVGTRLKRRSRARKG